MSRSYKRHELKYRSSYKKAAAVTMCAAMLLSSAGCGDKGADSRIGSGTSSVEDVLNQGMEEADANTTAADAAGDAGAQADLSANQADAAGTNNPADSLRGLGVNANAPAPEVSEDTPVLSTTEGVDIDLTTLSSTLVYSEVYNMMTLPEEYIGKTIRMEGMFSYYRDDTTGKDYFACIIQDATACCAQGIEFELEGNHKYPDDYPEEGGYVKVEGVFTTYKEGEYEYCTLKNAHML